MYGDLEGGVANLINSRRRVRTLYSVEVQSGNNMIPKMHSGKIPMKP